MNNLPRQILADLIAQHGPELCDDPRRCEALLKDLCGQHRLEIFLLVSAQRERVPQQLSGSAAAAHPALLESRLITQLRDNLGLTADKARWAVKSWAWVLCSPPQPRPKQRGVAAPAPGNYQAGVDAYARGDFAAALTHFRTLADEGHGDAQNYLGLMYEGGRGVPQSDAEAVQWFRQAADQGNAYGQNNLGGMYRDGRGVPQSDLEAVKWFRLAADQGNALGQTNLGLMYRNGRGVPQSDADAVKWRRLAAEQGNADAQNNLGWMYQNGRGLPQSDAEALKWYRLAAEQGNADAQVSLGGMYRDGRGTPQSDAEAVKWFRLAAEQGDAFGQNNLGVMYRDGRWVPQSDADAVKWCRLAAEQGHADAQNNLGWMYQNGRGVPQSDAEALKWYRLAAEQGYAFGQSNLGWMYQCGRGVPQSDLEAVKWFRLAADQGNALGQTNLGVMYANGRGVPQSEAEAVKWYRLAADQGNANAQNNLGWRYQNGRGVPKNDADAVKWFRLAAEQGNADAQNNLRLMYENGRVLPKNDAEVRPVKVAPAAAPSPQPVATTAPQPEVPDIHGRPVVWVQVLQNIAAKELGRRVVFRDPEFQVRVRARIKVGERKRFFSPPEPIYEDREVVTTLSPPEMVVIPPGSFLMGAPEGEDGRSADEGPQHRVTIARPFALGRYAVTFEEYDAFCAATGRGKPDDSRWGRGRQPVINVSWEAAVAYCQWLSTQTGQEYRLPSEAEWEYACRAGTATPFNFDATISTAQANYNGNYTYASGAKGEYRERTVAVGSLPANGWGLHEVRGNVWEWCEDCWNDSYQGAPTDGTAWRHGDCQWRVLRGGSWSSKPGDARAANRGGGTPENRNRCYGFRLARTLSP